jgi:hypothetical protein
MYGTYCMLVASVGTKKSYYVLKYIYLDTPPSERDWWLSKGRGGEVEGWVAVYVVG